MVVPEEVAQMQRVDYEELVAEAMASKNEKMKKAFAAIEDMRK